MKFILYALAILTAIISSAPRLWGQIVENGDIRYGNEWINYDQSYLKIKVGEDGIYRISQEQLIEAGVPVSDIDVAEYRLYWIGKEERLLTSRDSGPLQGGDDLLFYGRKNRSEVDRFLFSDPDRQMLNPEYGLTTDTSAYFLTWTPGSPSNVRFRRVENDLSNPGAPLPWYIHHEKLVFSEAAFKGVVNSSLVRLSTYGEGEGFASRESEKHQFTISNSQLAPEGFKPYLHLRMTGNVNPHRVKISWNGMEKWEIAFDGINGKGGAVLIDTILDLEISEIKDQNTFMSQTSSGKDLVVYGIIELIYPRKFEIDHEKLNSINLNNVENGASVEIPKFDGGSDLPIFLDITDGNQLAVNSDASIHRAVLPAGSEARQILVLSETQIKSSNPTLISFENLENSNSEFIIISHPALYGGENYVRKYADYRASSEGGNYQTQIIDINQLVDQFSFGIEKHPMSIKNFVNFIDRYWSAPQFIFLIGKGYEYRVIKRQNELSDYLPAFGIPASDNLLTSSGESSIPLIPVGRLAARSPEDVAVYLNKIMVMEDQINNAPATIKDRAWMKRVLHLSAGDALTEQNLIYAKMNMMGDILKGEKFGADITTVRFQAGSDIVDESISETTLNLINTGISLKTYYGHGSVSTTQFQGYEDPFFLDNKDRYPVMVALGCSTGNIFRHEVSLGESNILTPNKGGVVYLATSGLGYLEALDDFAKDWYRQMGNLQFGATIGECTQTSIEIYDEIEVPSIKTLVQQFTYHGDPAYRLVKKNAAPDLTPDYSSVKINPIPLDLATDSFDLTFEVYNLGKVVEDSFTISISHKLPNNTTFDLLSFKTNQNSGIKEFTLRLPLVDKTNVVGTNTIFIDIDANNDIQEDNNGGELNNQLISPNLTPGYEFLIFDSSIRPLLPPKYGVTNTTELKLVAASTNPFQEPIDYEFQIDTTLLFNSPFLKSEILPDQYSVLEWKPDIIPVNNTVYYWRVRTLEESSDTTWMESSFLYHSEFENGWNHSHYFQFLDDSTTNMPLRSDRTFSFPFQYNTFQLKNKIDRDEATGANGFVNSQRWSDFFRWEVQSGITFILLDPKNQWGLTFNQQPGEYSSVNETAARIASFPFSTDSLQQRMAIINFIEEVIDEGTHVIAYTVLSDSTKDLAISQWSKDSETKNLFTVFESLGAKNIRSLQDNPRPYIFEFIKGQGAVNELIANDRSSTIEHTIFLPINKSEGQLVSPVIGPATNWNELLWSVDLDEGDSIGIDVFGVSDDLASKTFLTSTTEGELNLETDPFGSYKYLQISINASDPTSRTCPQLEYFRLIFDGLPELVFDQRTKAVLDRDSINRIENQLRSSLMVRNLTPYPMDSLLVSYSFNSLNGKQVEVKRFKEIGPEETVKIEHDHSVPSADSDIDFIVELNPENDQPELYHFNNYLSKNITLIRDNINPVIDVTFDGKKILNEDIISPTAFIEILIDDENEALKITDTSTFRIFLTSPSREKTSISPNQNNIRFVPADKDNNRAKLEWSANFDQNGIYEMEVQGKDASGNFSGSSAYNIRFNVINESRISEITNYPNPFTSSTRFLYTLTGSKIPERYKITIFTVSGKVVRELTEQDLGPLQVGKNLTNYPWDGTDQFGDRLSNGIYLYKMKIIDDGFQGELFETSVDKFVKSGYNKLAIFR